MNAKDSYIFFDKDTAFEGEVDTDHLVLEGVITGDVRASKDVYLKRGSIVQGEIITQKYMVEDGSVHKGKLRMDRTFSRTEHSVNGISKADRGDKAEPVDYGGKHASKKITITLPDSDSGKASGNKSDSSRRLW